MDGLPYEFFKTVFPLIGNTFKDIIQCQLDRVKIISSDKCGATRLISKVKGNPKVDELRPITLLNTDYKILSKILVQRMKVVLPNVIRSGQLCSVGDRNILFGINSIFSNLEYVRSKKKDACILSLDFFKAYDRVLEDYVLKVMEKMNFGKKVLFMDKDAA